MLHSTGARSLLVVLALLVCAHASPVAGQDPPTAIAQQSYVKASNTEMFDNFGRTLAVSGDTLVVGAVGEDSLATGVGGDQGDDGASNFNSGAVYVFGRSGGIWSQEAYLKASNTGEGYLFGNSLALSGDTLAVGSPREASSATGVNGNEADASAPRSGAVYVFRRNAGIWSQEAYIKASNTDADDEFGRSLGLFGDTLVVGADREDSQATGVNGSGAGNGAVEAGAAYVFVRSGTTWTQQAYLKASNTATLDSFGRTVAVFGDTIAVGAPDEGVSGAAYVFERSGTTWSQSAYIKSSNAESTDSFGGAVTLSGNTLVVGAIGEDGGDAGVNGDQDDNSLGRAGAAYVFVRDGSSWVQQAYLKAGHPGANFQFGNSVALAGDALAVGSWLEHGGSTGVNGDPSDQTKGDSGAAYLFLRDGPYWTQVAYLKASNTNAFDVFGFALALSPDMLIVGAPGEGSVATGVNGDQSSLAAVAAGAVYVFELPALEDAALQLEVQGYPPNPRAFRPGVTSGPVLGATWDPFIDHTDFVPDAVIDLVRFHRLDHPTPPLPAGLGAPLGMATDLIGTLLCDPVAFRLSVNPTPSAPFALPIPANAALLGTEWCVQGASIDPDRQVWLTNAMQVRVGSF